MHPERFESWLTVGTHGLYCRPGGFHIDPHSAVNRAVITHAHSDHARAGHDHVLATRETLALMSALLRGDWARADAAERRHQVECSGLVAAYLQWHLEHSIRSLQHVEHA